MPGRVEIVCIFFDGVVPASESDEYVQITNTGGGAIDLSGWTLRDVADGRPAFLFPSFDLTPGRSVRVYTDEIHPEHGDFSFERGTPIWNNPEPDETALFDATGAEVSRRSYPPGC